MNLPLVEDGLAPNNISLGSEAWFKWLGENKSFRYCPNSEGYYYLRADVTVRNRTKDYWYAYRKVNGVQRTFYLGKTAELDYEKLQLAVDELSLSQMDYHKLICDRKSGVQSRKYTSAQAREDSSSPPLGCTEELYTLTQTNEELQKEVELLKQKLAIAEGVVEAAKEVVQNMIPSKSNMIRGNALVKLRDKLSQL
ncbi:MAG TPA: hypothetical protein VE944_29225 [Nostoc sp.]|uniref:hypothetical protein n=1 Tax=Nostoc sp. TaxID=1180 RepID=UPI002D558289|nr:hypothetical protein [Nostoc sp.]HYX18376.1 hypothetical protein [Nostoc sp.]